MRRGMMVDTNNKDIDTGQTKDSNDSADDERQLGMSDVWRARYLASLLHDLECTWSHVIFGDDCDWEIEVIDAEIGNDIWEGAVHSMYLRQAYEIMEQNDQFYLEELIRIWLTAQEVINTIGKAGKAVCKKANLTLLWREPTCPSDQDEQNSDSQ